MSAWISSFLAIAIVSGIPLAVTLLLAFRAGSVRRYLPHLTAFGAGALLGAAFAHLIPEALVDGQSPLAVLGGVIAGYAAFAMVERLLAGHDHAHVHGIELGAPVAQQSDTIAAHKGHSHLHGDHEHTRLQALVPLAFAGDVIHNLVDGMLIAAGFLANPAFGFLTAAAIGLHELPRELGTYGLFVHGGVHPMRAVSYNLVTAVVAFAGAAITLLLGTRIANFGQLILPFAAGSYIYIAFAIGQPVLARPATNRPRPRGRAAWLVSGFALMGASALLARG